jgi:hypothetical protein
LEEANEPAKLSLIILFVNAILSGLVIHLCFLAQKWGEGEVLFSGKK